MPVGMSIAFEQVLKEAGTPTQLSIFSRSGHSDFLFDALSDKDARVLNEISRVIALAGE